MSDADVTPEGRGAVAIAASAGGLNALRTVLQSLPPSFPVPILVVEHLLPSVPSRLAGILGKGTALQVKEAEDLEKLVGGTVYVAPSNSHLVLGEDAAIRLDESAPVRFQRPSADVLFRSLADHADGEGIAVVLSGMGSDGAEGARAVKAAGGHVIAQNRDSSEYFGMPSAAIATGAVDDVLPLEEIGGALTRLVSTGSPA